MLCLRRPAAICYFNLFTSFFLIFTKLYLITKTIGMLDSDVKRMIVK